LGWAESEVKRYLRGGTRCLSLHDWSGAPMRCSISPSRISGVEQGNEPFAAGGTELMHVFISILGLWLLFMVLRSMIRIALMNRHYRDVIAETTGRAVYMAVEVRLGKNRDTKAIHPVLVWFLPAYILSLIAVYFVGAMTGFALLYWGTHAGDTWHQVSHLAQD
jgi:hypothetical protein